MNPKDPWSRTMLLQFLHSPVRRTRLVSYSRQGAAFVSLYCYQAETRGPADNVYQMGMN